MRVQQKDRWIEDIYALTFQNIMQNYANKN